MRFFFTGPEAAWRDAIFFHKRFVKNRIITKAALFGNFFQWKAGIDQIFRFDQSPLGNDFVKAGVKLLFKKLAYCRLATINCAEIDARLRSSDKCNSM